MNPRLELYRQGGGLIVRTVTSKRGKRVAVLDPARRAKAAAAQLLDAGMKPQAVAYALGVTLDLVKMAARKKKRGLWD